MWNNFQKLLSINKKCFVSNDNFMDQILLDYSILKFHNVMIYAYCGCLVLNGLKAIKYNFISDLIISQDINFVCGQKSFW